MSSLALHALLATALAFGCPPGGWVAPFFDESDPLSIDSRVDDFLQAENGLVVVGSFEEAGGTPVQYVARFDGSAWHSMGALPFGSNMALAQFGSDLVALADTALFRWDGVDWVSYAGGHPVSGIPMTAIGLHDGELVVALDDHEAESCADESLWTWDGVVWTALDLPAEWTWCGIREVLSHDGDLYVAGQFLGQSSDLSSYGVALWDGQQWSLLGGGLRPTSVTDIVFHDGSLVAASLFWTGTQSIYRWNGVGWEELGDLGDTFRRRLLTVYHGDLIASHREPPALNPDDYGVIETPLRWDGSEWCPLGPALKNREGLDPVHSMQAIGDDLLLGGIIQNGGNFATGMAVWRDEPVAAPPVAAALGLRLEPAVPNPANPSTRVRIHLDRPGFATVAVYDARGRHVRTLGQGRLEAGPTEMRWDGRGAAGRPVSSGVYQVRVEALGQSRYRAVSLVQ